MKMTVNLTETDYEILRILQGNARASISDISRELGLSRVTVRQRIKKLIENGIIKKFTVILDDRLFEQGVQVLIGFKAPNTEQLVEELGKMDIISEIYVTSGEKNVICKAMIPNIKMLKDMLEKFVDLKIPFETNIVLKTVKKAEYTPRLSLKLKCDYCGKEIIDEPYTYTLYNRRFYFCCPICLREFKERIRTLERRKKQS